jgi:glycosyltransferase involved in cell wall biosynthesis
VFTPDGVSNGYVYRDLSLELQRLGHHVTVLTTTPHYNIIREELAKQPMSKRWGGLFFTSNLGDVNVIHIPMIKKSSKKVIRILSSFWFNVAAVLIGTVVSGRQDVVFASSPPLTIGLIGRLLGWIWRASSVYIVQDVFPDGLIRQGKIRAKVLIAALQKLERLVYNANDAVVVIAHSFVAKIKPRMSSAINLHLIENFVDTELYRPLTRHNDFSRKYGLDDCFVVSYVGNIGNAQDFSPVLAAAKELKELPIKFVMIGDGILRKKLEEQIHEQQLNNVKVLGYIPRDQTPWANASSDISLVLLSAHVQGDGFPSKIFTIMACARTAIITADADSDLNRVVRESGCGMVVPVGDHIAFIAAVKKAFNERDTLVAEGEKARDYVVRKYSKEASSAQYDQLIYELCAEKMRYKSR